MSDNNWQNDWILTDSESNVASINEPSRSSSSSSSIPKFEIHDQSSYGNVGTAYRPTVKVLKRDANLVQAEKDHANAQIAARPDYKTREENYNRVREKIFGSSDSSGHNNSRESIDRSKRGSSGKGDTTDVNQNEK